ncbi:MAG: hypothetical protein HOD49_12745 [Anaerolineae bacterium]|nr:hypothetical protein [Anaerolineae bacterium]
MSKNSKLLSLLALITLFIFACTLPSSEPETNDPNIIFTAAAETASVQLTNIALNNNTNSTQTPLPPLSPPTTAPSAIPTLPSITPTEDNCDKAKFITDVTVPDGTVYSPGEGFTKTWRVKNIGTCTWTTGYALVFDGGEQMSGGSPQTLTGNVAPGATVDISVNLTAPATTGTYTGNWQIKNTSNVLFAKFYVQIKVANPDFAVTGVDLTVSGSCGHFTINADITTNGAGDVTYKWKRSDGATDNANHPTLVFASAGTKSVSTDWFLGAAGSHWMDIYIDDPNHQQFGRANFSCP